MKKIIAVFAILALAFVMVACNSVAKGEPGKVGDTAVTAAYKPDIIDYKGAEFGKAPVDWINVYIDSDIAGVEKMDRIKGKYAVVVEMEGASKEGVMLALSNLKAPVEIAGRISTRVQQRFAGAQVGDVDKIETYMENVVKVAREATFSGFTKEGETWVYLQYYKPGVKPKTPDKAVYRGYQLWTIEKDLLQRQIDAIMNGEAKKEPPSPEKQQAMDRVREAFYEGF